MIHYQHKKESSLFDSGLQLDSIAVSLFVDILVEFDKYYIKYSISTNTVSDGKIQKNLIE